MLRVNDRTTTVWVLDVFYTNWNLGSNDLLHRERVNDLGAIVGQLGRLVRCDDWHESRRGNLARISCKDTIDFLPDLKFSSRDAHGA